VPHTEQAEHDHRRVKTPKGDLDIEKANAREDSAEPDNNRWRPKLTTSEPAESPE